MRRYPQFRSSPEIVTAFPSVGSAVVAQTIARRRYPQFGMSPALVKTLQYGTVTAASGTTIDVPLGTITITGYAPTVTVGGSATIDVPLGTITVTGFAPSVDISGAALVDVPAGTIVLVAYAPSVSISAASVWTAVSVSTGTWTPQ